MTPQFHSLPIVDRRDETADSLSIAFAVPLALREDYRFRAGQFVTLRATVGRESLRRAYSICVPEQAYADSGELRIGVRRVAGGRFSNWLADTARPGQTLEVMTPDGRFGVRPQPGAARHFVGFAGGSGITPMLSLIATLLQAEAGSRFTLVYGNRSSATIMFLEALEDLKNRFLERFRMHHVLSAEPGEIELLDGLLDEARCRAFLHTLIPATSIDEAFVCGPDPMMDAAEAALRGAGLAPARIHIERFGVPLPASGAAAPAGSASSAGATASPMAGPATGADASGASDIVIVIDGKSRSLKLASNGPALLDAGLAAGLNLPFSCKGGVCCTCRARVLEGEVRMDRNYTLEPHEIEAGFVLTCQAHPMSERVVVSYDER